MTLPAAHATLTRYENALARLVEGLQEDRAVLAVILCGSLVHGDVWEKSDIDLVVVTTDDVKESSPQVLDADGINVHTYKVQRGQFKNIVQGSQQGAFLHTTLSDAKILYTRDPSITDLFGTLGHLGGRDREIALLRTMISIIGSLNKAEKWLSVKHDPLYCFFWIMKLVDGIAQLEVLHQGKLPGREAVMQAKSYNPALMGAIYDGLIEGPKTAAAMENALALIREHLLQRSEAFAPVLSYLDEAGGLRSISEINHYFLRQFDVESVDTALEWLAEQGVVQKLSVASRLTPKSRVALEEVAFTR